MDLNITSIQKGQTPDHLPYFGMTLKDYFAAKAMQALLSTTKEEQWFPDEVASIAYEMANAMIKESEKQ